MNAPARKRGGVLHDAKLLQGQLVRLAERRERRVSRATGEFEIDLIAAISAQPLAIARMVLQAVSLDQSQAFLQRALAEALVQQSELLRAKRAAAETEPAPPPDEVDDSFEATFRPPPPIMPPPPRLPVMPVFDDDTDEPDDIDALERTVVAADSLLRYPEPGEPARMLPDGSVVAVSDGGA